MQKIQAIFWDFDGVLMDSNGVRDVGFERVLSSFPREQVDKLMEFHRKNGGISRYVKFRYFYEEVRGETPSEELIQDLASQFSQIMRSLLTDPDLLIRETLSFVKENFERIPMHIVSGSDQEELRYLCRYLQIDSFFKTINGSPTPKRQWVHEILNERSYKKSRCVLIGDSINDYEAALVNEIGFMAYNNPSLDNLTSVSIPLEQA